MYIPTYWDIYVCIYKKGCIENRHSCLGAFLPKALSTDIMSRANPKKRKGEKKGGKKKGKKRKYIAIACFDHATSGL